MTQANQLLQFFYGQGIGQYGMSFKLGGAVIDTTHETALMAANDMTALVATVSTRAEFVSVTWNQAILSESVRDYAGLRDLLLLFGAKGSILRLLTTAAVSQWGDPADVLGHAHGGRLPAGSGCDASR